MDVRDLLSPQPSTHHMTGVRLCIVDRLPFWGGLTNTGRGLQTARTELLEQAGVNRSVTSSCHMIQSHSRSVESLLSIALQITHNVVAWSIFTSQYTDWSCLIHSISDDSRLIIVMKTQCAMTCCRRPGCVDWCVVISDSGTNLEEGLFQAEIPQFRTACGGK